MKSNLVDIAGQLRHETEKAYLFYDGVRAGWLPKSQCAWDASDATMAMPEWLAIDRELL